MKSHENASVMNDIRAVLTESIAGEITSASPAEGSDLKLVPGIAGVEQGAGGATGLPTFA